MNIRKALYNKIEDCSGKDNVLNKDISQIAKDVYDFAKKNSGKAKKFLLYTMPLLAALNLTNCTLRSPTMPTQPKVTANATMFSNTGTSYTLTADRQGTIEWKRPCDSTYTQGNVVPMQDGCYGTLEVKVNGVPANGLTIHKDEITTDNELQSYINSIKTGGSTDPKKISSAAYNVAFGGKNFDAFCQREDLGSGSSVFFYVVRVSNNDEELNQSTYITAASPADVIFVNPTEDQATKIQNYLNQF